MVITPHFSRKKAASLQESICKRSRMTVQQFAISFPFCTVVLLRAFLFLTPPPATTISYSCLSSSRAFLIRQTEPILLSKAATPSSYQPVTSYQSLCLLSRERRYWNHGSVDS